MASEQRAFCSVCPCGVVRSAQRSNIFRCLCASSSRCFSKSRAHFFCLPCWLHKRYTISATNGTFRCKSGSFPSWLLCGPFLLGIFSVASRLQWWVKTHGRRGSPYWVLRPGSTSIFSLFPQSSACMALGCVSRGDNGMCGEASPVCFSFHRSSPTTTMNRSISLLFGWV